MYFTSENSQTEIRGFSSRFDGQIEKKLTLFLKMISTGRFLYVQRQKSSQIPAMEEWMLKLMEMVKELFSIFSPFLSAPSDFVFSLFPSPFSRK